MNQSTLHHICEKVSQSLPYPQKNILGVFPFGSIFYGSLYDEYKSDIDCCAIYVPTLEDITVGRIVSAEISLSIILDSDSPEYYTNICVLDVRKFFLGWSTLRFMEILHAPNNYFWINPIYKEDWNYLKTYKETIVAQNCINILREGKGTMLGKNTFKTETVNSSNHYRVHHSYRLYNLLKHYLKSGKLVFQDSNIPSEHRIVSAEELLKIKKNGLSIFSEDTIESYNETILNLGNEIDKVVTLLTTLNLNKTNLIDMKNIVKNILKKGLQ